MSLKQFSHFLSERFLNWGEDKLKKGFRYQFQSPDNENSLKLFEALIHYSKGSIDIKGTSLPVIACGKIDLLPVLHCEDLSHQLGFTENFISHLRDEVAGQVGQLKGCSLLVIHNSMLDTLINSADDLAQPTSVWHPEQIKQAMYGLINDYNGTKKVSECLLEHRFNQIVDDEATMFGFEDLYNALLDGELKFSELGLLNDPAILTWSDKPEQITKRLEENKKLYEEFERITHHFPQELEEKLAEKDFGAKFVAKYFGKEDTEAWKNELEFSACKQEQESNRQNLLELENEKSIQGELITKSKADTKAGRRERHLILLLEEDQQTFDIEMTFIGGKIDRNQCSVKHNKTDLIEVTNPVNAGGVRSRVSVKGEYSGQATFFIFTLKREKTAERHKFKVLVLRAGDFYVEAFRNNFLIDPSFSPKKPSRVILQTEDNSFKISEEGCQAVLNEIGQVFDNTMTNEIDFGQIANESDELHFGVKSENTSLVFNVEGAIATDSLSLPLVLDQDRFSCLYQDDYFGSFNRTKNKVLLDNKEISPKGKRLTLLQREAELLDNEILTRRDDGESSFYLNHLEENYLNLYLAYQGLFDYYIKRQSLPSLCSWGTEFRALAQVVVEQYNLAIAKIEDDILLSESQKQLVNIGFATFNGQEYITPFHPLVIAYYLALTEAIIQEKDQLTLDTTHGHSFKTLPKVTLSRLNPRGLLPFIYHPLHGFSFSQLEKENCFWMELVPQQETSFAYVRKLVKDKVTEFKKAFSALFNAGSKATLIINSVNNRTNHQLFMGVVDFVKAQKGKACQIHVNLYDDKLTYTEFDRFAEMASYDELKVLYGLDKGTYREQADTIIDLLRTQLTYSKFENSKIEGKQAYSHLSFFRNNTKVEPRDVNVDKQLSGVVCHGLMAGEAAANKQDSYFTAFGLKNVEISGLPHLVMAQKLGGLIKPARSSSEPTGNAKSMALVVSDNFKALLERSYENSIWTTIIDPKVTLDFFDNAKDMVLIHYSDSYTNSANYDAITVTRETELYKKVLEQDEGGITAEFNAFNGEWLLKLITANANERKEKKGIIGAYKFVNCLLSRSDITWVPLSVAEMIRVTGNIGLKMSDSDFSRNVQGYKSGLISDDVLFVGFKDQQMYLLPLEVKTGIKQTHNKGVQQAKELKRYLSEDILGRKDFAGKLYRGLFIRQVLMQVDKYQLYNLYAKDYFDAFLAQREYWLQGDYGIADLVNYPDGFMLSHVENDTFFEADFTEVEGILKIQLPISYLKSLVSTPLAELMQDVRPEQLCHIPEKYLLKAGQKSTTAAPSSQNETFNAQIEIKGDMLANGLDTSITNEPSVIHQDLSKHSASEPILESLSSVHKTNENLTILVGYDVRDNEAVYWEPTNTAKFMNTNSGIIGTMGTGKTQCTKSVVTQLHQNQHLNLDGKAIGVLIFDYKSDYVDDKFLLATKGKKYNLHKLPYNPLSLFGDTPMLPVHTARGFAETMGKAFGLGQKQQLKLRKLIGEAYELAGINKSDKNTWNRPAPTMADIWALFEETEPAEDSLYAALESLYELEIFEDDHTQCTSLYELVDGITVIELAGYPSEIQNLVVALTMDLFYSQMQKQGKPEVQGDFRQVTKLLLVDEADNFMSQNFPSLRKVLKEGREYGVGVILSTQDITHFKTSENDYSAYILSWVVHRVSQIKNQDIKSIFNKDDKQDQESLMQSIRELEKHYSLYVDGDKKISKIKDKAFWELIG
ncbi:DNA phosphorothioation-dependent restriction protein DptH [uncultured Shewanella sp.]|uniref:DNA phosphorothioation-dependent restriction protein DptH n=1 Tax=uncultured Shewanella sp. TaxID=173975 RepID=UPI0026092BB9|nr:DNA phosphorothioation-dependent restriction protein DptH [uncultured Shewanella sp.]